MNITIIGCGLIGGSIALALKRRRCGYRITCIDLPDRMPAIQDAGVADRVASLEDLETLLPDSSIVILATPVQMILDTIDSIRPFLKENTIVTDVGSTKKLIMEKARTLLPAGVHFIGGHPMAGSERSGVEASDPLLFNDRVYVLCPYPDTPSDALLVLMDLVDKLNAQPVTIDPQEHDRIMAMISHLPHIIAVALMNAAMAGDAEHAMLDKMAGRGFLDMTRLSASDYGIWQGILETNSEAIAKALSRFTESLSFVSNSISKDELTLCWERAGRRRRNMGPESLPRPRKQDLRSMIDQYDRQILSALANRIEAARRIGKIKTNQSSPVTDPDREKRMLHQRNEWGISLGLPDELINELFAVILKHSTKIQSEKR
ncbi:MAG: prephenate dehydrogenase/arogenate dehydrogenase family protein [Acidobacteriota bacterium]|jgi:prephenate dehydrogenase